MTNTDFILPEGTNVLHYPQEIQYRLSTSGGLRVVRVFFSTSIPRLSYFGERSGLILPIALNEDEIKGYIADAKIRFEGR